ncbi:Hypothetical_protein [Hexamita inflata]|uniref:Hypothetical_protein n=1 Tax=Hexamita inflata TaxID=28002 RepID=A0AA86QBX3_9EUKA|nr:Hypothetical protein HINF_LOCUS36925 [Hexamita inflata]
MVRRFSSQKEQEQEKANFPKFEAILFQNQLCWEHVKKAISMIKPSVIIHGFEKTQLIRQNTTQEPLRLYVLSDAERIMGFAQTTINKRQWQEQQEQEVNRTLFPMDYSDSEDDQMLQQDVDYQYFGAE